MSVDVADLPAATVPVSETEMAPEPTPMREVLIGEEPPPVAASDIPGHSPDFDHNLIGVVNRQRIPLSVLDSEAMTEVLDFLGKAKQRGQYQRDSDQVLQLGAVDVVAFGDKRYRVNGGVTLANMRLYDRGQRERIKAVEAENLDEPESIARDFDLRAELVASALEPIDRPGVKLTKEILIAEVSEAFIFSMCRFFLDSSGVFSRGL
jgi:hypothetical protein